MIRSTRDLAKVILAAALMPLAWLSLDENIKFQAPIPSLHSSILYFRAGVALG